MFFNFRQNKQCPNDMLEVLKNPFPTRNTEKICIFCPQVVKFRDDRQNTTRSRVLTSYVYQNGYCEYGESQRYHCGTFAVDKLPFVAPKFRLRRVQKKGKKEQNNLKSRFAKNTFLF